MGVAALMVYWRAFLMRCTLAGLSRVVIRSATSSEVADIGIRCAGHGPPPLSGVCDPGAGDPLWWRIGTVRMSEK
jgi:hypothetical protein